MRLILSFAATAGLAALAACSANQDNAAANLDSNAETVGGAVLPIEDNATQADTLGNQLNQLNETGNATESANSAADAAENTANSY